jgi:hypothetical protein
VIVQKSQIERGGQVEDTEELNWRHQLLSRHLRYAGDGVPRARKAERLSSAQLLN